MKKAIETLDKILETLRLAYVAAAEAAEAVVDRLEVKENKALSELPKSNERLYLKPKGILETFFIRKAQKNGTNRHYRIGR